MKYIFYITTFLSFLFSNNLNMDLIHNITFDEESSDLTGFYQDGREFAVVGLENSTIIIDITNPDSPIEITSIEGGSSIWRDIKYWNRHIYIGTEAIENNGIQIVSVDDLDNPVLINTIDDFGSSHNIWIYNGYLYVVGTLTGCDIWIYSLENPSMPLQVGCWDGEYIHDIDVYNEKIYASAINSSTIYILDIENMDEIEVLASWNYPGKAHDCSVHQSENILVTADEMLSGHMKIWDISNYNNIELMGEFFTDMEHSIHNVYIENNLVFCSYYADGVRVVDITNPTEPIEVAYYDTSEFEGLYVGNWGVYPFLPSGNIIASDIQNGLFILDLNGLFFIHDQIEDQTSDADNYTAILRLINFNNNLSNYSINYRSYLGYETPWQEIPLLSANENLYFVQIPKQQLASIIQYYFEVLDDENNLYIYPDLNINEPLYFLVDNLPILIEDDLESFSSNYNWNSSIDDDATSGIWEWGIPNGTELDDIILQPYTDATPSGINCYVTGNHNSQNPYYDNVDNGTTSLISPIFNVEGYESVILSFGLWYTEIDDNSNNDFFNVDISNDLGDSWTSVSSIPNSTNGWVNNRYIINESFEISDGFIVKFSVSDFADSSLVEAAIDDISISPFGNPYYIGDNNFDDSLDILDVVTILSYIYDDLTFNLFEFQASDLNYDNTINILDIVVLVDLILFQ